MVPIRIYSRFQGTNAMIGCNAWALITCCLIGFGPQASAQYRRAPAAQAEELVKRLDTVAKRPVWMRKCLFTNDHDFEITLQKLIKLGPAAEKPLLLKVQQDETQCKELQEKYNKLQSEVNSTKVDPKDKDAMLRLFRAECRHDGIWYEIDRLSNNLELLTALRRVQKKPDPLSIQIVHPTPLKAIPGKLPTLMVTLKSLDIEKKPIWCETTPHGHGTHRYAQYRLEVKSVAGKTLPVISNSDWGRHSGGTKCDHWLEFGGYFHANLPMGDFVDLREPGDYTVTVLYHPKLPIADIKDPAELDNLIVFRSESFKLTVDNGPKLVLTTSTRERKAVNSLIAQLPNEGEIKVVGSGYESSGRIDDEGDFGFIPPHSPAGKILTLSWQAVPALLDSLSDSQLSRHQKTWVLSLLYSITFERELDPGSIGVYSAKVLRAFQDTSAANPTPRIEPQKQDGLIQEWKRYRRKYLDIRESEDK